MKKLFWLLLLATASAQVTVVGTISDPTSGGLATSGYVQFDLKPSSSSVQYYISGGVVLAPQTARCGINASGQVKNLALSGACLVWGVDVITPVNLTYCVSFAPGGVVTNRVCQELIAGSTYNLNSPVFGPAVTLVPQYATYTTNGSNNNITPSVGHVFNIGTSGTHYAAGYFDNLFVTNPITPSVMQNQQFVFAGDSLFAGLGLTTPSTESIPAQAMLLSFFKGNGTLTNDAVSGSTIADVVARYNAHVKPLCQLSANGALPQTWLFLLVGLNNIGAGNNGVTTGNAIVAYTTQAKLDGCRVVAFLQYQTTLGTAAQVAQLHNMNLVIRQSPAAWDYLVDLDRPISNSADAVLFQSDHVHPTAVGAVELAGLINSTMEAKGGFQTVTVGSPTGNYNLAGGLGETIGIGTQTPLNTLDVWCPSSNLTVVTNEGCLSITNSDLTIGNLSGLLFRNRSASAVIPTGRIAMEATAGGSYMHFQGSNNYATGNTTDIMIADGQHTRLGIGGTPTQTLDVFGASRLQGAVTGVTTLNVGTSLVINGGAALTTSGQTGTGSLVLNTSPSITSATLVTPALGVATGTSLNLGATAVLSTTAQSGTGSLCMTTSCVMVTPTLGVAAATSLAIGGGSAITKVISTTAVLDFPNQAAIGCADLSVTVSGSALGDVVTLGVPNASVPNSNSIFFAWVQTAGTVFVRHCSFTNGDPGSGTFRVDVTQH